MGPTVETANGTLHTVKGDLFRIYEWYGWTGERNTGRRMLANDIAAGIVERELIWGIRDRVVAGPADSSIFDEENGNCVAEDMADTVMVDGERYPGIEWEPADKSPGSRKQGWEQIRKRLKHAKKKRHEPREYPGLFIYKNHCVQFERTVPSLPRDEKDPDDVNTEAEDHIGDEVRYRVRYDPGPVARVWD